MVLENLIPARPTKLLKFQVVRVSRFRQNVQNVPQVLIGPERKSTVPTFIDLAHDGQLQVLPVVLSAVDPKQDSAELGRQPEGRQHVEVRERSQSGRQLLHGGQTLLGVLESQQVYD